MKCKIHNPKATDTPIQYRQPRKKIQGGLFSLLSHSALYFLYVFRTNRSLFKGGG